MASASSRGGSTVPFACRPSRAMITPSAILIVEAIRRLKVVSIVIDGEAMCFTGAQHDFGKLWNCTHDHEAKLCAFDLLELDGDDYRDSLCASGSSGYSSCSAAPMAASNMLSIWRVTAR
jgi:hypothetical protein